ncbi:MAG: urea amidolyase [Pelagimonas sp.]|jgi:allophanate hydrolase|nr:urea amidolyase [Pelagimonas sp.]
MSAHLIIDQAGPGVSVQDGGRVGLLSQGLSRGGAADRLALAEGAALLSQPIGAALEMAGYGGKFRTTAPARIALTGAPMRAILDGVPLAWNASHLLPDGAMLEIGATLEGSFGYMTVGGGFDLPEQLGAVSAHLNAGLGRACQPGDQIPLGRDSHNPDEVGWALDVAPRWQGGALRVVPSLQTDLFPHPERARFETTAFTRDARGNRMGMRLLPPQAGFGLQGGQTILSEIITPGDLQIPGDGAPFLLLSECQTTGGYPRIGTVIPADMPKAAQTPAGAPLRFAFVTRESALEAEARFRQDIAKLSARRHRLIRDPADCPDLLSLNLISGVLTGEDLE